MPTISATNETADTVDLLISEIPKSELVNLDGEQLYGKAAMMPVLRWLLRTALGAPNTEVADQRIQNLLTVAEAAWLLRVILGAPDSATTVARLQALMTDQELQWLRARITEALA